MTGPKKEKRSVRMKRKSVAELKQIAESGSLSAAAARYELAQRGASSLKRAYTEATKTGDAE